MLHLHLPPKLAQQSSIAAQAAVDAVAAPAVKLSAAGSSLAIGADWLWSGPGLIALASLAFTGGTFGVSFWASLRRERRAESRRAEERAINAARLRRLEAGLPEPGEPTHPPETGY